MDLLDGYSAAQLSQRVAGGMSTAHDAWLVRRLWLCWQRVGGVVAPPRGVPVLVMTDLGFGEEPAVGLAWVDAEGVWHDAGGALVQQPVLWARLPDAAVIDPLAYQ